jgi:Family of unknown function (DUF6600)/FecR protein
MKRLIKRLSNVPPHVAIILVLVGIVGASGAILLLKHTETKAEALVRPRAARLEHLDGNVDVAQALNQASNDQLSWADATVNAPLVVGDRVWARGQSHAQIALTGRNYVRLNPDTALDVLSLADRRTQLALRNGSAVFDVGDLPDGELYEVATPCGAVDFTQPGLYQLGIGDDGNATVSVLNGLAQVVGLSGSGVINKGEVLTLAAQAATQALVARLAPDVAGNILDDYYGYRYPHRYDGRYHNYDAYLDNPNYYDPYSRSVSYEYIDEDVPGLYDLDEYGDWQDVDGYGHCWVPRVAADWSPYRQGYWEVDNVWGPTWVSSEPWGYAPYHYGRWAYVNQQRWAWVPEGCRSEPAYAPALVAFVPVQQNDIGWVPLAPGEPYVPRYYNTSFEPQYLAPPQVVEQVVSVQRSYANLNYPTAVTVVPAQAFTRPINQSVIVATDPQWVRQARPVLDPYQVDAVRQVAFNEARAERKQARREMATAMFNRPVVTSVAPVVPAVGANAAQALQYQAVPEKQKRNKLQFENSGQVVATQRADGVPLTAPQQAAAGQRDQRIAELRARLQQGDRSAKQELRQLKQERRQQPAIAQPAPPASAPAQQAPQQAMSAKQQRRLERQQQAVQQQQAAPPTQQQAVTAKQQRRLERQQQMAARQQQAAAQQAQVNQQREQRRAQKQAARQQMMQQQQAQRSAQQQQVETRRQQKQLARQQARQQATQQAQMNQRQQMRANRQQQAMQQQAQQAQIKAQRRAERQQAAQQQQWQAAQQAQQSLKAQRRAERQQQVVQQQQRQQPMMQQQQQVMRQQEKQQRRFERQQQAAPQAPAYQAPAAQQSKAERKAARRNQ